MPLPISSAALPPDVAHDAWPGITVQVAWTLVASGIRVRPAVLRDARDHVLFHLDPNLGTHQAEDLAVHLTRCFIARARRREPALQWSQDAHIPLSPRWKRDLERSVGSLSDAVLRQHFGDGRTLADLEAALQVDRIALEAACGGLREVVRRAAIRDGIPLHTWPAERIDALLSRLAALAVDECPPMIEVVEGCHRGHVSRCPLCARTVRLVRAGVLTEEDLVPPVLGARPSGRVDVLAVHLHPDGREHRPMLVEEAGVAWVPLGEDMALLDASDLGAVTRALVLAAEVACPSRDHVRAAVLHGPGRWSRHGLLGPVADRALTAVRALPWGEVEPIGALPEALPEPPRAHGWWASVAAGAVAATALGWLALSATPSSGATSDLDVTFTPGRRGAWVAFDLPDEQVATVVREVDGHLEAVLDGDAAAKGVYATGDGGFRLHAVGTGVLVARSSERLPLGEAMAASASASDPLLALAAALQDAAPDASVRWYRR